MILRMPMYCKNFICIADKCKDNCCIGWEIDIDKKTAKYYKNINGIFGDKLKNNITSSEQPCFILGDNERCPFLNSQNLCDIILNLGEENLCQICTDHPRYYEWFENIKEGGIGLCCEESARIILSQNTPLTFWDRETENESADEYDIELYNCLHQSRDKIIKHLESKNIPLKNRICDILEYTENLQFRTDNNNFDVSEIHSFSGFSTPNFKSILEFLLTLEPIDDKWIPYLESKIKMYNEVMNSKDKFEKDNSKISQYLQNIAVYFVWRYFLKGVFDGEFLSRIKICAISTAILGYLFCCEWLKKNTLSFEDCVEISKNYSKEIEYCEENLYALADISYEESHFSTQALKGIFQ